MTTLRAAVKLAHMLALLVTVGVYATAYSIVAYLRHQFGR